MKDHFTDRLLAAVAQKGVAACVGLDPLLSRLPESILASAGISPDTTPVDPERAAAALACGPVSTP